MFDVVSDLCYLITFLKSPTFLDNITVVAKFPWLVFGKYYLSGKVHLFRTLLFCHDSPNFNHYTIKRLNTV